MLTQSSICAGKEDRLSLRRLEGNRIAVGRSSTIGPEQMGVDRKEGRERILNNCTLLAARGVPVLMVPKGDLWPAPNKANNWAIGTIRASQNWVCGHSKVLSSFQRVTALFQSVAPETTHLSPSLFRI